MSAIRELFTGIAGIYDRMNHALTLGLDLHWRHAALGYCAPTAQRLLDLACGTGDSTLELARTYPQAERIVGADLTPAMLEIARVKCRSVPAGKIEFQTADAGALPFAENSFDLVTCAFGFRNFPDRAAALAEVARVLVPGGELLVLEFFHPHSRVLGTLTALWLRLAACILAPKNRAAYAYLRRSMQQMLTTDEFIDLANQQCFSLIHRHFFFPACTCLVFQHNARTPKQSTVAASATGG